MSFVARTPRLQQLADIYPARITELENIFLKKTNIYIDRANVYQRQSKLGRHIDIRRLYQFLRCFDSIDKIRLYHGTIQGDEKSEKFVAEATVIGYHVSTKPVKIMQRSIDIASMHDMTSDSIIKSFVSRGLLQQLDTQAYKTINTILQGLNQQGIYHIEEKKCNFDVEIGVDMMLDYERSTHHNIYQSFILWSGDSDFVDIVNKLSNHGKKVYIFATAQRVSSELSQSSAIIVDINKIRDFICWPREIQHKTQEALFSTKQKGVSEDTP